MHLVHLPVGEGDELGLLLLYVSLDELLEHGAPGVKALITRIGREQFLQRVLDQGVLLVGLADDSSGAELLLARGVEDLLLDRRVRDEGRRELLDERARLGTLRALDLLEESVDLLVLLLQKFGRLHEGLL